MTHTQWERGERLTVNNATKEQLKWMVRDLESKIRELYDKNVEKQHMIDFLLSQI